ncbi:MAG: hypothetical protein AAF975_01145, partial [Spirochaetota bacterium]
VFPLHYQDCFEKPELLPQYLSEEGFVHAVEKLLYQSQEVHFRNDPDSMGEFLLEYRDTFLRALGRFEQKEIPLESYIGFLFKTYRKNFAKIKQNQQDKYNKIYTNYSEWSMDKISLDHYLDYGEGDIYREGVLDHTLDPISGERIMDMARSIMDKQGKRAKRKMEWGKILRILLLCNEKNITENDLAILLPQAGLLPEDYHKLLAKRDTILGEYRIKRNELKRKLQRSYLNYLVQQRSYASESCTSPQIESLRKLESLSQILSGLRFRYLHMRCALTFEQVRTLTEMGEAELRVYYNGLKNFVRSECAPEEMCRIGLLSG